MTGVLADIRTEHRTNTNQERYRYIHLLGKSLYVKRVIPDTVTYYCILNIRGLKIIL
jgi:hypothetical protein